MAGFYPGHDHRLMDDVELDVGNTLVGAYAMAARRHMHEYGTTSEQLAEIAVGVREYAGLNPKAMYRDAISVEDAVNSRLVADPLHKLDCCVISDGGGALIMTTADRLFAQKVAQYGPEVWRQVEKSILMQLFDQSWKDHLLHLDHLRQGIGLRAYGQKDPLNEYKSEAFNLFNDLLTGLREQVVNVLANLQLRMEPPPTEAAPPTGGTPPMGGPMTAEMREIHEDPAMALAQADDPAFDPADPSGGGVATLQRPRSNPKVNPNDPSTWGKVSRNAACPCGSGKKFKHCHGRD